MVAWIERSHPLNALLEPDLVLHDDTALSFLDPVHGFTFFVTLLHDLVLGRGKLDLELLDYGVY